MAAVWSAEEDLRLRSEAMVWLARRTNDGADSLTTEEIREFRFRGEAFPLMDPQRGILKPAVLAAALSLRTVYRPEEAERPYEDGQGPDGLIRYKYRGTDPDHPENRSLRLAMSGALPLVWFFGVGPGVYLPTFPAPASAHLPGDRHPRVRHALRGLRSWPRLTARRCAHRR